MDNKSVDLLINDTNRDAKYESEYFTSPDRQNLLKGNTGEVFYNQ